MSEPATMMEQVDKCQVMDALQDLRDVEALLRVAVNAEAISEPDRIRVVQVATDKLRGMSGLAPFLPDPELETWVPTNRGPNHAA